VGALFGPVLGAVASQAGVGWTFGVVGAASLGLAGWAAATPAERPDEPQPLRILARVFRDGGVLTGFWFVVLPALLFGTLSVLAPLRLSHLGVAPIAIGGTFLAAAACETVVNLTIGRASDRHGPLRPALLALAGSAVVAALLPWPTSGAVLALLVVAAGTTFGSFFTPGMTMLSHAGERLGLDYGYTFALVNLAWAPGQTAGAAGGGTLAHATADATTYLLLAGVCALTLAALWGRRASTASTTSSATPSSGSWSGTTAGD